MLVLWAQMAPCSTPVSSVQDQCSAISIVYFSVDWFALFLEIGPISSSIGVHSTRSITPPFEHIVLTTV
jgi:hypothetical protein